MTVSSQASITAMQAVTSPKPGDVIEVAGYQTPHDGGGGTFFFDTTHITSAVISTVRITGAGADPSRPGPIVIKAPGHRFTTGQAVLVEGVAGTSANGRWLVAVDPLTPDSFTLLGSRGDGPLMAGDARATSITVTTSSPHGLAPGGRACIAGVVETGDFRLNGSHLPVGTLTATVFTLAAKTSGSYDRGGSVGDGGVSFPSNAPSTGPARGGRWIRRRDRGELNVKWFGAVGGGKADDTEHLVATIRAARTLATGVYLPAQNFKTTEEIRLETLPIPGANDIGLTIRGEGAVPPTGDRTRISAADTAMRSVISVDAGNVTIQGVTLHCSGAADHALYLQAAARLHLDDVQVFSAVKDGCRVAGRRDSGEPANSDNVYVREFNATVCGTMYCSPSLAHRYGNMRAIVPTAGSVSCKAGNQTITGTGTAFRSIPARPGDFIVVGDTDGSLQKLEIARIVDDATIEVDSLITPSTSLSGQPYAIGVGDGWSDALDVAAAGPLVPGDNSRARMDTGTFLSCAGSGIVSRSPYGPLLQHQEFQFCGFAGIVVGTLSGASALQFNTVISHAYFEGVFLGACVFVAQARGITIDQPMWAGQPAHRRLVFSTIAAHNAGIVGYVADINTTDSGASALHPIGDSTTTDIPALTSLNLKNTGTLIMPSGGAAVIIDRSPWTTRIPVTSRNLNFVADRGKIDSAADITATPTFPAGVDGQEIAVCNVSEHPLTFHDCRRGLPGTLGTGLVLDCAPGGSISLARGQIVEFYFSSTNSMSGLWTQRGPVSASAPVLVSLAGNAHAPGGDTMVVKGRNLDEASLVYIGSGTQKFGNITSTSSTSLTFTMPPMAAGTYNVLVTTGHGASNVLPLSVAN